MSSAHESGGHEGRASARAHVAGEPSFAERARTLVHLGRVGTLSTHLRKREEFPFGSVAPYGVDGCGRPTFLISRLAVHTQNLLADARASLLVTPPGGADDPLAVARVTLVGTAARVPEADVAPVRADYLARHDGARSWADFGDFAFYRLEVADLYYVAGFGAMGWVDADAYRTAAPDPLADSAASILAHMNADHRAALLLYCRTFAGVEADEAVMMGVDRLGMHIRARSGDRVQSLRISFPREVRTPEKARAVLVEMVRTARGRQP